MIFMTAFIAMQLGGRRVRERDDELLAGIPLLVNVLERVETPVTLVLHDADLREGVRLETKGA